MSDTPLTDAAISQFRFHEKRGEWFGDDVLLYVEPGDCRMIERELRERIAELEAERNWRPIETAPRDGTYVLLATPKGRMADGCFGNYHVWAWPYVMVDPTHWMPLPDRPTADAAIDAARTTQP